MPFAPTLFHFVPMRASSHPHRASTAIAVLLAGPLLLAPRAMARFEPVPFIAAPALAESEPSRFHFTLGVDYTTAYFFRGFAFEDSGLIVQPYADFAFDVLRLDATTVSLLLGTWNSFHGQATDAGTGDSFRKHWFESDLYAGIGVETGRWTLAGHYNVYTSPSDAWETVEEVQFSAALDDSEWLGRWSLQPWAVIAIETGSNANDGGRKGTYLELGIAPGLEFDAGSVRDIDLRFPISLGLSLSNYYEGENGENDAFGFAALGAVVSVPIAIDESWGAWAIYAGVQCLYLGDAAATYNSGENVQVIGTAGVSVEF